MTLQRAAEEIRAREPLFHCPAFGTSHADFDRMMAPEFFEIGASGHRYSRETVLAILAERHSQPQIKNLSVTEFSVRQIDTQIFQATYILLQPPDRWTRRSTLWRWNGFEWSVIFQHGTIMQR